MPDDQDDKSRMNREVHVRICGSREVKVLPATRPAEIISHRVWLYYHFLLSLREVEEMMLARRSFSLGPNRNAGDSPIRSS